MRKLGIFAIISIFAATACWPFSGDSSLSPMTLTRTSSSGKIEVVRGDDVIEVRDQVSIDAGDVIKTSGDAYARARLEGDRVADIGAASSVEVVDGDSIASRQGSVLVRAEERTSVSLGDVTASTADSIFRIDRGYASSRSGVYSGSIEIAAPGRPRLSLEALFEVSVVAGDVQPPRPYRLDSADKWDRVLLRDVVDLDEELRQLATGLARGLADQRPQATYFKSLAGGRAVGFVKSYLRRPPPDLLIGFSIASNTPGSSTASSFGRAFDLFDQGARWGLVATILDARAGRVVADLEDAILATGVVASGGTGQQASFAAPAEGSLGTPPGTGPGNTTPPDDEPDDHDDGEEPKKPKKPKNPPKDCTDAIDCALQDAGIDPSPSPSPTDIVGGLLSD